MNAYFTSLIRTLVPMVIGAVGSWAARRGFDIQEAEATAWLTPVVSGAYYIVVRKAEERYPVVGWLLGMAKPPVYEPEEQIVYKTRYVDVEIPKVPITPPKPRAKAVKKAPAKKAVAKKAAKKKG